MATTSIIDRLNMQLEDQLTRLNSDIKGDDLKAEVDRTKAMCDIGKVMISNNRVALDAIKLIKEGKLFKEEVKPLLLNDK